jgi:hypothetical protein
MKAYVFEGDAAEVAVALKGLGKEVAVQPSPVQPPQIEEQFQYKVKCPECEKRFANVHGMRIHRSHVHRTPQLIEEQEQRLAEGDSTVEKIAATQDAGAEESWEQLLGESLKIDGQLMGSVLDHVAVMKATLRYHPDGQLLGFESISEWWDFLSRFAAVSPRIAAKMKMPNKWKVQGKELSYGG